MNPLTLAELSLRHSKLVEEAERLRLSWRRQPTGSRALAMGKRLRDLEQRAADYRRLLEMAEQG
ncbi:hypothetical protein D7294_30510 [Streptomyces hoynatensis]|uniref:Uncharacterized protein n=1 Tax=Streptomyces hoynatensis TaxID=1141874 RepID=A0A3A9YFM7_9ACTN|nr:hypothetical protein D7294_30510 [Streptomyces hoynatensis]